jgi:hypothetical protein
MVEELVSALLGVAVLSTVVFGTHALFPRSAKGVAFATVVNFGTLKRTSRSLRPLAYAYVGTVRRGVRGPMVLLEGAVEGKAIRSASHPKMTLPT